MSADMGTMGRSQGPRVLGLLADLREAGVAFDLDRSAPWLRLAFNPRPPRRLIDDLTEHASWLLAVAVGRYSGHAPAACSVCGDVSLISLRTTTGAVRGQPGPQGGKPAPWPACLDSRCTGSRVVADVDRVGVAPIRPPAIPRAPKVEAPRSGLPWPSDPSYRGG